MRRGSYFDKYKKHLSLKLKIIIFMKFMDWNLIILPKVCFPNVVFYFLLGFWQNGQIIFPICFIEFISMATNGYFLVSWTTVGWSHDFSVCKKLPQGSFVSVPVDIIHASQVQYINLSYQIGRLAMLEQQCPVFIHSSFTNLLSHTCTVIFVAYPKKKKNIPKKNKKTKKIKNVKKKI